MCLIRSPPAQLPSTTRLHSNGPSNVQRQPPQAGRRYTWQTPPQSDGYSWPVSSLLRLQPLGRCVLVELLPAHFEDTPILGVQLLRVVFADGHKLALLGGYGRHKPSLRLSVELPMAKTTKNL